ncbi:MAG: RNA polymerase subunit sigma-24 [Bacteroidetes bacterium CG_4_10_14_3_um_filter_31_20]|nr:MAG: RNA polymerase subunit sigma-24 [Bacteroidetes bacterium CG_4_8_14_3_um_filter_31_14]PIY03043.1 MAG: RNA polymerase subunit sigma-24 [Bacteroidetes bacterium CG_4_10_14_3_um_filter_31_20]
MEISHNFSEKALQDYQLVQNAIKGDQKSYAELLGRYRDAIYFMLLKMVCNKIDAEDLTIEAFGKAFKYLGQYSPSFAFSTWLFKIASNNCIDFLRKKKSNIISIDTPNDLIDQDQTIPLPANVLDPEEELIKSQKINIMRNIVCKLKPRYRRLIELRYFYEYSYEEISRELELPAGTIKAQLYRARELLYNIIKNSQENI